MNAPAAAPDQLEPRIRELFGSLDHAGELTAERVGSAELAAERILTGEAGREALGTRVRFTLGIAAQRVVAARYRAYGCPHTLAACEWLARELEGRSFEGPLPTSLQALRIDTPLAWAERLGIPAAKLGRLLVVEDALRAALTLS